MRRNKLFLRLKFKKEKQKSPQFPEGATPLRQPQCKSFPFVKDVALADG
jgi:hypothetical protein